MMPFKDKAIGIFWTFLFLAVLLQLSASQVIPFTTALGFSFCFVGTFLVYIRLISKRKVKKYLTDSNMVVWLLSIFFLSLGVALVLLAEGYIVMQLTMKKESMKAVLGEYVTNLIGFFMISVLISVLNYSFEKYKDYLVQEKEWETLKRKSLEMEISLLRTQLSPHFTFNILNNLQFLIRKDKEEALHLLERYSKILRYYVYESQKEQIPLQQEVAFLKEYFSLEMNRHVAGLEISCDWNIPENDLRIIPFVLSTFVENAFKHVLPNKANAYFIRQTCYLDAQGILVFEIVNTFDETVMTDKPKGIGLKHAEERLALAYPQAYRLKLQTKSELFSARLELKLDK